MGWAYGKVNGREVGYSVTAKCDEPGCDEAIDRGLAYCCGGMHGGGEYGCGDYFCGDHLSYPLGIEDSPFNGMCDRCHGEATP